jgi:hypothetical protein
VKGITKAEDAILRALVTFPYATGKQITSLLYSDSSHRSVLQLMKQLADRELVLRKPLPSQILKGSVPYVYWLSAAGRHYLESLGYDFSQWVYPHQMKLTQSSHLWHALAVNDFLIAGVNVANSTPDLQLMDIRHDLVMQMTMSLPVKSDGWQLFHIKGIEEAGIWLELDRGTELEKVWKEKIEKIIMYIDSSCENDFGTSAVTLAAVVPANILGASDRVRKLKVWTENQLTKMNKAYEHDLFRFLVLPETYTPDWLYLSPVWDRPFDTRKHRLVDV